ncbi:MAG TPA: phosphotransferase [Tepidisphaeraceae bacterium]|jgi:tRNA A-37 threonylcarbamoyl transferase component Bud32|nr:phosphotransferase [Tepidisphaeraceae bacterium]
MDDAPLDIEQFPTLLAYLRRTGRIGSDEQPALANLAGGVSNRTVLLSRENGEAWVLKQALPKLRVAVEWLSDPIRIVREAEGMSVLSELTHGGVPRLIFVDREKFLLAMQAVPLPHDNFKSLLLGGTIELDHFRQFGTMLGQIQRGGWLRREEFSRRFADRQFFESLRLEPYYLFAAEQSKSTPHAAAFLRELVAQTRATANTLVHGDYSPKNVLVHAGKLILLDHEVIHFGDGAFDVGFSFAHILSKAHHLPRHRATLTNMAILYWNAYREALGDVPWRSDLSERSARHALGCLLARCIGRSPLEYLSPAERRRQARAIGELMRNPPDSPVSLVGEFLRLLEQADADH